MSPPQNEAALRAVLEGAQVVVELDMPATKDGVDLYPERDPKIDFRKYGDRIKKYGVAIEADSSATITLVKVKGKHIEFQLDGGGYGTSGDETPTREYISRPDKTQREKDLEQEIRDETDSERKRRLQRDLDDLRRRRERDYQDDVRAAQDRYDRAMERVREMRPRAGSRFNIRFDRDVPASVKTAAGLKAALAGFVRFAGDVKSAVEYADPAILTPSSDAPTLSLLPVRKGMTRVQVEAVFGPPASCEQQPEGRLTALVCRYELDEASLEATFVNGALVGYVITSR